jgi:hypothetical protein
MIWGQIQGFQLLKDLLENKLQLVERFSIHEIMNIFEQVMQETLLNSSR